MQKKPRPKHIYSAVFHRDHLDVAASGKGYEYGFTGAILKDPRNCPDGMLVNEYIAATLGTFLRLPIPPHAIAYSKDLQSYWFTSLNFNFDDEDLPEVRPDRCAQRLTDLCTGIIVFDMLIANCDRHEENLVCDDIERPTSMRVFDHDQSLLAGGGTPRGIERLEELGRHHHNGIDGSPVTSGLRHCLLDELPTARYFPKWIARVQSIPCWLIESACQELRDLKFLENEVAKAVEGFVKIRREIIGRIVRENHDLFPRIKDWPGPKQTRMRFK
jgi:hypothetical protein